MFIIELIGDMGGGIDGKNPSSEVPVLEDIRGSGESWEMGVNPRER